MLEEKEEGVAVSSQRPKPGHRTQQTEHGLNLSSCCLLQAGTFVWCTNHTTTDSSSVVSDYQLGKRGEETSSINFLGNHLVQIQDLFGGIFQPHWNLFFL